MSLKKKLSSDVCSEHPLGILCRCSEYKSVIKEFKIYTISTISPLLLVPKCDKASEKVIWIPKRTEKYRESEEPFILNSEEEEKAKAGNREVDKRWIPVRTDVVSPKYIRPNECYLHQSHLNTQSAAGSTLTDMLPHGGRVIKRKDIPWGVGSHKTATEMTDDIETRWGRVSGCFTPWADAFTVSMSCPPF